MRRQLTTSLSADGMAKHIALEADDEDLVVQLLQKYNVNLNSDKIVTFYPKMMINEQEISSKYLSRVHKQNNYSAAFTNFGEIKTEE